MLVQSHRNSLAAKKFFRRLLKGLEYVPRVIVTDMLGSYQVAHREVLGSVEHRQSRYLNNRAQNSHQPTRQRESAMKRFTSPGHAQRFLSAFSSISPHFRSVRHRLSAAECRTEMADRFAVWREITATDAAALMRTVRPCPISTCPKLVVLLNFSTNVTVSFLEGSQLPLGLGPLFS